MNTNERQIPEGQKCIKCGIIAYWFCVKTPNNVCTFCCQPYHKEEKVI